MLSSPIRHVQACMYRLSNAILYAKPQKIVYVSCNPATQARDIQLLSEMYKVDQIQPVDMFPHTHHVENVALLTNKINSD